MSAKCYAFSTNAYAANTATVAAALASSADFYAVANAGEPGVAFINTKYAD
jgi:hypothetical protein